MHHPIIGGRLAAAAALALVAALAACAEPAPPPAAGYAPPPGGYSGTSSPPAARLQSGYGSSEAAAPRHFVASRLTPLRTGPREAFDIRAVLPPGTPVTTDGFVGGDWWQV